MSARDYVKRIYPKAHVYECDAYPGKFVCSQDRSNDKPLSQAGNEFEAWLLAANKLKIIINNLNAKQMSDTNELVKGIRIFEPRAGAPEFVKLSLVITLNELVQFAKDNAALLSEYNGQKQLKIQILKSQKGGLYCKVDTYKPKETAQPAAKDKSLVDDDLPF